MINKKEMFKPEFVEGRDLPDLWFQAVAKILQRGRNFRIDEGSYAGQQRLEYNFFLGHVAYPEHGSETQDILPHITPGLGIPDPATFDYVYKGELKSDRTRGRPYINYIMTSHKEPGEAYTYGERITKARLDGDKLAWWERGKREIIKRNREVDGNIIFENNGELYLNQIEDAIDAYKKFGYRNNQIVLQVAEPTDRLLNDPPCLRQIDTRIQDGALNFIISFRSWDLWNGLPSNLAGIEFLHKYMASCIGVEQGIFIVDTKGLHLYDYTWGIAEQETQQEGILAKRGIFQSEKGIEKLERIIEQQ